MGRLEEELNDLHPDLRKRVRDLIWACPHKVGITSAYRSYNEQKRLYDGYKAGKPGYNPANPPGYSKHERTDANGNPASEAVDLNYYGSDDAVAWVHRNAEKYGLHFPIRRENWHAESNYVPYRSVSETMAKLDDEDLRNIKAIVDKEVNEIYWLLLGVDPKTPRADRPTLKKLMDRK